MILVALSDETGHGRSVCITQEELAEKTGMSVRSVQRNLNRLEGAGLVHPHRERAPDGTFEPYVYALIDHTTKGTGHA